MTNKLPGQIRSQLGSQLRGPRHHKKREGNLLVARHGGNSSGGGGSETVKYKDEMATVAPRLPPASTRLTASSPSDQQTPHTFIAKRATK